MAFRNSFIFLLIILSVMNVYGQIGGLSGSKLNSLCVDPVDKYQLEFEPGFYHLTSRKCWNNDGRIINSFTSGDSLFTESALRFRFTYGVSSRMEIGVNIPADLSVGNWGFKYELYNNKKSAFALMGGVNTPFGNGTKGRKSDESAIQAGLGAIYSWSPSADFSTDFSIQGMQSFPEPEQKAGKYISVSADAGYYLFEGKLQPAIGLGFQKFFNDNTRQYLLTLYPGITIETGKDFIITIIQSVDIAGRNIERQFITDLSFTFTIH